MYIITRARGLVKNYFEFSFRILMSNLVRQKEREQIAPSLKSGVVDLSQRNLSHCLSHSMPTTIFRYSVCLLSFPTNVYMCFGGFSITIFTLVYQIGCRGEHTTIRVSPAKGSRHIIYHLSSLIVLLYIVVLSITSTRLRSFYTLPRLEFLY